MQNDPGSYRPRSGANVGVTLARNSTGSASLSSYRTGYSGEISSTRSSSSVGSKERPITATSSGYGGTTGLTRRDKINDEKPSYKFTCKK